MALVGMDTDLATTQAQQLSTQGVDAIQNLISTLEGLVGQISANWKGTDASNFHNEWSSTHRAQLQQVHTALSDFHTTFTRNIQEQIHTSAT
jgi:uncharacterized protein YukE